MEIPTWLDVLFENFDEFIPVWPRLLVNEAGRVQNLVLNRAQSLAAIADGNYLLSAGTPDVGVAPGRSEDQGLVLGIDCTQPISFLSVIERLGRARCTTARETGVTGLAARRMGKRKYFSSFLPILRAAVPPARSSLSITGDEKRKEQRAVYFGQVPNHPWRLYVYHLK